MAAIDNLKSAVVRLNTSADAVIAKVSTAPKEADIQAVADSVNQVSDKIDASVSTPAV